MTRFKKELSGALGEYWKQNAEQEIEKMRERIANGEIGVTEDGAAYWYSSGNFLPSDCVEILTCTGFEFSAEATDKARQKQSEEFFDNYRRNAGKPGPEELAEMRAAFGKGATVVDVITGEVYIA